MSIDLDDVKGVFFKAEGAHAFDRARTRFTLHVRLDLIPVLQKLGVIDLLERCSSPVE